MGPEGARPVFHRQPDVTEIGVVAEVTESRADVFFEVIPSEAELLLIGSRSPHGVKRTRTRGPAVDAEVLSGGDGKLLLVLVRGSGLAISCQTSHKSILLSFLCSFYKLPNNLLLRIMITQSFEN